MRFWQDEMENSAEATAHMYDEKERADILFVVGKNKEVSRFLLLL